MSYNPESMKRLIQAQENIKKLTEDYISALHKQIEDAVENRVKEAKMDYVIRNGLPENNVVQ